MTSSPDTDPEPDSEPPTSDPPAAADANPDVPSVPASVDWILGGLVVVVGLLFAVAGLLLFVVPDRERIEAMVAPGAVRVEGMTKPEFVEVTLSLLPWLAAGLVLTGLVMAVLGGAYVVHRRRVRERAAAGDPVSNYPAHALLGAVVSAMTSFVPLSPVIGGGLAGYLERGDSERTTSVGAASAAVMSAPFLVLGLFAAAGLAAGFAAIGDGGLGGTMAVVVVVAGLASLGVTVLLGAGGGWVGGRLAE